MKNEIFIQLSFSAYQTGSYFIRIVKTVNSTKLICYGKANKNNHQWGYG